MDSTGKTLASSVCWCAFAAELSCGQIITGSIDLDAYFNRVQLGWGGQPEFRNPGGAVARSRITDSFRELRVLLRRGVQLDINRVQDKLVQSRRGGYCFEHATLFAAVLEKLGFKPVPHSAHVILRALATASPSSHMLLTITLPEGVFVVDPGFGPFASRISVSLRDGEEARSDARITRTIDGRPSDCA